MNYPAIVAAVDGEKSIKSHQTPHEASRVEESKKSVTPSSKNEIVAEPTPSQHSQSRKEPSQKEASVRPSERRNEASERKSSKISSVKDSSNCYPEVKINAVDSFH